MPSNEVYSIHEDAKGFLWFCTDNGVVRFDGSEMRIFHVNDGMVDPVVF
jgi:ligand-binding sensor domain-containing protein